MLSLLKTNTISKYTGTKIHLNPNGNDSNVGNYSNPVKTFPEALSRVVSGKGDIIIADGDFGNVNWQLTGKSFYALVGNFTIQNESGWGLEVYESSPDVNKAGIYITGARIYSKSNALGGARLYNAINCLFEELYVFNSVVNGICYAMETDEGALAFLCGRNYFFNLGADGSSLDGTIGFKLWDDGGVRNKVIDGEIVKCATAVYIANVAAAAVKHSITRLSIKGCSKYFEQASSGHHWGISECSADETGGSPDIDKDGFGDVRPFPSSGFDNPDPCPLNEHSMESMIIGSQTLSVVEALPSAGSGGISVDHNTGGTDNMRVLRNGVPLDNVEIWAYLKTDYDAGNRSITYRKGWAKTGVDGRWRNPMYLDAGNYTFTFFIQGESQTATKEATVS